MKNAQPRHDRKSQRTVPDIKSPPPADAQQTPSIAKICASLINLLNTVSAVHEGEEKGARGPFAAESFSALLEERSEALWDNISDFAETLSQARSESLDDVAGKITVWRQLAPESEESAQNQPVDVTLLLSIMEDIERLTATHGDCDAARRTCQKLC
jgi:hypothetical protein